MAGTEPKKRSFNNITVIIPSAPLLFLLATCPKLSKDSPSPPVFCTLSPHPFVSLSLSTNVPHSPGSALVRTSSLPLILQNANAWLTRKGLIVDQNEEKLALLCWRFRNFLPLRTRKLFQAGAPNGNL